MAGAGEGDRAGGSLPLPLGATQMAGPVRLPHPLPHCMGPAHTEVRR